jgi:hypothetical protein
MVAPRREVTAVNQVRTIHSSPEPNFVAISVDFENDMSVARSDRSIMTPGRN